MTNKPINDKRVATGSEGLDSMLYGGFLPGSMALVRGAPGTGKTSLALQFLIQGAKQNEAGLFISFEEFPHSLYRDAESLGWDLRKWEEERQIHMIFTSPKVFLASLSSPDSQIDRLIRESNIQRLVLDSVSHFNRLTNVTQDLRQVYTSVVNGLRRENITAMLLGEEGPPNYRSVFQGGLSFVVDNIILLRYVEIESAMRRAIVVLKTRGSNHVKDIRRYEIATGGLHVREVFEDREGLLSGVPHRSLS